MWNQDCRTNIALSSKNKLVAFNPFSVWYSEIWYKFSIFPFLKLKIGTNSTWEGAFYQSEWVKINSCRVFFFFIFLF